MFYIHYTAFFAKIKSFLQKIEKMFDFVERELERKKLPDRAVGQFS